MDWVMLPSGAFLNLAQIVYVSFDHYASHGRTRANIWYGTRPDGVLDISGEDADYLRSILETVTDKGSRT